MTAQQSPSALSQQGGAVLGQVHSAGQVSLPLLAGRALLCAPCCDGDVLGVTRSPAVHGSGHPSSIFEPPILILW